MSYITASILYDYLQCPHRVWRDQYGPQDEKVEDENLFIKLLWERGVLHEKEIIDQLGEYENLSHGTIDARLKATEDRIEQGVELIYQGVIKFENLLGIPDLLQKTGLKTYIPIDIKSGRGYGEYLAGDEPKLKRHYAVQLSLYAEILNSLGYASEYKGIIIDGSNEYVDYDLNLPIGKRDTRTYFDYYCALKNEVYPLIENRSQNIPALGSVCKNCVWQESCKKWIFEQDDLTKLFYLGRSKRDGLNNVFGITKTKELISLDLGTLLHMRKENEGRLKGLQLGEKTLEQIHRRALIMQVEKKPVLYEPINLPKTEVELYLDIEDDPMRGIVYLHGIYEKTDEKKQFIPFVAGPNDETGERTAFEELWKYLRSFESKVYSLYYYSSHEKSVYKSLGEKYPDIITSDEVQTFFQQENVIDLYSDVILKKTDWPLSSYSLKEIASYLGFKWRDDTPSGALSIQWYSEYCENLDEKILQRILDYNEDDCLALMRIKEWMEKKELRDY